MPATGRCGKLDRGHGRPGGELPHRLGHERSRKGVHRRRDGVLAADAARPARARVIRSTNEKARKWPSMRMEHAAIHAGVSAAGGRGGPLLPDHQLAEGLHGEQPRDVGHLERRLEPFRRHLAEEGAQPRHARRRRPRPPFSNSASDRLPRASSTILPRGIFTLNAAAAGRRCPRSRSIPRPGRRSARSRVSPSRARSRWHRPRFPPPWGNTAMISSWVMCDVVH